MEIFKNISWNLCEPLSKAQRYNKETNSFVDIKDLMDIKVPVKQNDQIAILYHNFCRHCNNKYEYTVVLTEKFTGKPTVKNVLKTLEKGLNKTIKPGDRGTKDNKNYIVYSKISGYVDSKKRKELIDKYEKGKLKVFELLGDNCFFEGMGKKGKLIEYYVGS